MKTFVFDIMLDGRFICTLKYKYCALFPIDFEDLEKFVLQKRPTLKGKDFRIVFLIMKQKLLNIKHKLIALWWFLTRKNYYLLSYNGRVGKTLESTNIVIPEFIEWVRKKHRVPTNHEIIMELNNIGTLYKDSDVLAYNEIKALIEKLKK